MGTLEEMSYDECLARLREESVGRAAICTPSGPQIVPVNYVVDHDAVVFGTSPFSALGVHGRGAQIAFEVDRLDHEAGSGWSVVAVGRAAMVDAPANGARYRIQDGPWPGAPGTRQLHLRLPWRDLSGRRVGKQALRSDLAAPAN